MESPLKPATPLSREWMNSNQLFTVDFTLIGVCKLLLCCMINIPLCYYVLAFKNRAKIGMEELESEPTQSHD